MPTLQQKVHLCVFKLGDTASQLMHPDAWKVNERPFNLFFFRRELGLFNDIFN